MTPLYLLIVLDFYLLYFSNPINKGTWEKLTSMMRNALPNSDISITWDNNYKP